MIDPMAATGLRWWRRRGRCAVVLMHGSVALMAVARMVLMVMVVRLCLGLSLGMLDAGQSGQLLQRNRTEAYGFNFEKKSD